MAICAGSGWAQGGEDGRVAQLRPGCCPRSRKLLLVCGPLLRSSADRHHDPLPIRRPFLQAGKPAVEVVESRPIELEVLISPIETPQRNIGSREMPAGEEGLATEPAVRDLEGL